MDPELRKLLAAAHAAGASDDDLGKLIDRWHADHAGPSGPVDISDQLQAQVDARQKQAAAAPEPLGTRIAREMVNVGQGLPGGQAAESEFLHLTTGKPYSQAYQEVGQMVAPLPTSHKVVGRLLGAAPLAAALPFGVVAQGAIAGAADPLLAPNQTPGQRVENTALGAGLGAGLGYVGGKVASTLPKMVQAAKAGIAAKNAPSLAVATSARDAAVRAADEAMYGTAADEAANVGGSTPPIRAALKEPDIAPYVREIRNSRTLRGADDATVLREAYKLMSERQGMLEGRISNNDFKAGTSLENRDIGAAKGVLKAAAAAKSKMVVPAQTIPSREAEEATSQFLDPHVLDLSPIVVSPEQTVKLPAAMPSFPKAVAQHSDAMNQREAFRDAADASRAFFSGRTFAAKNIGKKDVESFVSRAQNYTPEQMQAAEQGVLGRLKEQPKVRRIAKVVPVPSKQAYQAADLLRAMNGAPGFPNGTRAPGETLMDFLAKTGLLATQPNFGTP